jgi:hypothetical protein
LTIVAGLNSSRVSSSRLIVLGFGSRRSGSVWGNVLASGTLRPKRAPIAPIVGVSRSLKVPSTVRPSRCEPPFDPGSGVLPRPVS